MKKYKNIFLGILTLVFFVFSAEIIYLYFYYKNKFQDLYITKYQTIINYKQEYIHSIFINSMNLIDNYELYYLLNKDRYQLITQSEKYVNKYISSVWLIQELTTSDKKYINSEVGNEIGRFAFYTYKDNNKVKSKIISEYDCLTQDYALIGRYQQGIIFLGPYKDTYNDKDSIYVISIIKPIYINHSYVAVIGVDISLSSFYNILNQGISTQFSINDIKIGQIPQDGVKVKESYHLYNLKYQIQSVIPKDKIEQDLLELKDFLIYFAGISLLLLFIVFKLIYDKLRRE